MNRKQKDALLKEVELFSGLSRQYLSILGESCHEKTFKEGETLMEQGQRGLGLIVIVSGSVRVVKKIASGEELEVGTSGPGEFIGEIAVLDDSPRSASVIATEDTECLVLASWTFNAAMKNHPEIALEVLPVVVRRYRETNDKLLEMQGQG